MTTNLDSILTGMLLGDSSIEFEPRLSGNHYYRIQIAHCPNQLEYFYWKKQLLENSGIQMGKVSEIRQMIRGKMYTRFQCRSTSGSAHLFAKHHRWLYKNGVRRIKRRALNTLDTVGLAIWYCDDGSFMQNRKKPGNKPWTKLSTHAYSLDEQKIMAKYFRVVWGIECTIIEEKQNKGHTLYYLNMRQDNHQRLIEIVSPIILEHIPSMSYKLGAHPRGVQ